MKTEIVTGGSYHDSRGELIRRAHELDIERSGQSSIWFVCRDESWVDAFFSHAKAIGVPTVSSITCAGWVGWDETGFDIGLNRYAPPEILICDNVPPMTVLRALDGAPDMLLVSMRTLGPVMWMHGGWEVDEDLIADVNEILGA